MRIRSGAYTLANLYFQTRGLQLMGKIDLVLHWLYFSESEFFGKSMNIRSGASLATL